jgi:hypothetical protein
MILENYSRRKRLSFTMASFVLFRSISDKKGNTKMLHSLLEVKALDSKVPLVADM